MIQEQLKKEASAAKKVFRGVSYLFAIAWGLWGLILVISPLFPLGIVFIAASSFILWRLNKKKIVVVEPIAE